MEYRDKVFRAGVYLDRHVPNWYKRIDVIKLFMMSDLHCILAQLFGSYGKGQDALNLNDDECVALGLQIADPDAYDDVALAREFEKLDGAWAYEIDFRLEADQMVYGDGSLASV